MWNAISTPPHAAALMQSLRDIGYELDTALADLIDNSISAKANEVEIYYDIEPKVCVAIVDNGDGMTREELFTAMIIGSKSPLVHRKEYDLGRFGLGLKTASFSQCKRLTVVTKQFNESWGMRWDLNKVTQKNEWLLEQLSQEEIKTLYKVDKLKDTGTIVIWEDCDRLYTEDIQQNEYHLYQKFEDAENHLGLVFHRFLDKSPSSVVNLDIMINSRRIGFIDPFCRQLPATQEHSVETIRFKDTYIEVQGFTLPHHSKCSREQYEKNALGNYRDSQGFYVYRADRLLIAGDWFRLVKKSELTALTRVRIDLPNHFDSEWHIDIKKSHAKPPDIVREQLKSYIDKLIAGSKRVYRSKGYRISKDVNSLWNQYINKNLKSYQINKDYPLILQFVEGLSVQQRKQFNEVLGLIEQNFPIDQMFAEYASSPKDFKVKHTDEEIEGLAKSYLENFVDSNIPLSMIIEFLKHNEPYNRYRGDWNDFLNKL